MNDGITWLEGQYPLTCEIKKKAEINPPVYNC